MPKVELVDWYRTNGGTYEVHPGGPSLTRQEFAAECDINEIMRRYETTGVLPNDGREPQYVDFTEIPEDLMSTLAMMDRAQQAFMTLPARVRREFENNPHAFVEYASHPDNLDQMREWGLAPPKAPEAAVAAPGAVSPAPPQAGPAVQAAPSAPPTQSSP